MHGLQLRAGSPGRRAAASVGVLVAVVLALLPAGRASAAAALAISTRSLTTAVVGTTYSQALAAGGGTGSYTWAVSAGNLPAGLSLSADGIITGTPTARGKATFTVTVTDAAAAKATQTLALPVSSTPVSVLAGADRFATAVAVSQKAYVATGSAGAVVLARADDYPDALVGAAFAASKNAPLLFASGDTLPETTRAEVQRVLQVGSTVYLLGGAAAIPDSVGTQLDGMGYIVVRYGGANRFATAVAVADALGDPTTVLLATGNNFPDALAAGPAATKVDGVVLLTNGSSLTAETSDYLAAHPGTVYAIGGPASAADPGATAVSGADRYLTASAVATRFFTAPRTIGVASGTTFADALAGGAFLAHAGGPLVLTDPGSLPASTSGYLSAHAPTLTSASVFGGATAISEAVQTAVGIALGQ